MKKVIIGWICSVIGILIGGVLLCIPSILYFAITLIGISGISYVVLGVLALLMRTGVL